LIINTLAFRPSAASLGLEAHLEFSTEILLLQPAEAMRVHARVKLKIKHILLTREREKKASSRTRRGEKKKIGEHEMGRASERDAIEMRED
jgi:hypothetical protein